MWYAQLDLGRRERWQRGWEPSPLAPWRTPGGHVSWCMWFSAGLLCRWLALPAVFHTCESDIGSSKRLRLTFKHRPLKALLGLTGIEFAPSPIQNGTEKTISFLIWWVSQLQLFILVLFLHVSCFLRRKLENPTLDFKKNKLVTIFSYRCGCYYASWSYRFQALALGWVWIWSAGEHHSYSQPSPRMCGKLNCSSRPAIAGMIAFRKIPELMLWPS